MAPFFRLALFGSPGDIVARTLRGIDGIGGIGAYAADRVGATAGKRHDGENNGKT